MELKGIRSKITSMRLVNFMASIDNTLEFNDSNIISLCGYNDNGKSMYSRALDIILFDSHSNNLTKYINDAFDFFTIELNFDDGVKITKTKYRQGALEWWMTVGDDVLYTNRLSDDTLASVRGTPALVAKYLGVVKDDYTKEKLNVRTKDDKLFLVKTTGGDNYKIFNSVLNCTLTTEVSKRINEEKNRLQSDLSSKNIELNMKVQDLDRIQLIPEQLTNTLISLSKSVRQLKQRYLDLCDLCNSYNAYKDITVQPHVNGVDFTRLDILVEIIKAVEQYRTSVHPKINGVDIERLLILEDIIKAYNTYVSTNPAPKINADFEQFFDLVELCNIHNNMKVIKDVDLSSVDQKRFDEMMAMCLSYNDYCQTVIAADTSEAQYQQATALLKQLADEQGFRFVRTVVV